MLRRHHGHHRGVRTPISASRAAPASTLIRDTGAVTRHGLRTPTSRADLRLEADPLAPVLPIIGHHTTKVGMSDFRRPILRPISRRSALRCVRFWAASLSPRSRSDEHTYELQSLMRLSYAVFCL